MWKLSAIRKTEKFGFYNLELQRILIGGDQKYELRHFKLSEYQRFLEKGCQGTDTSSEKDVY